MFQFPKGFLESISKAPGLEVEAFTVAHDRKAPSSIRLNPRKLPPDGYFTSQLSSVPWSEAGFYIDPRPSFTFDPLFHAGTYYVQEASSMFLEQALKQHLASEKAVRALDLAAAPGGKTTHLRSLLPEGSLLVSNDVVSSRVRILMDNLNRWGAENVLVTHNDPSSFGKLDGFFDLILLDAPCSGSGLFRKDPEAAKEWSQHAVGLCQQRQKRILEEALPALRAGGLLIYSTCSYSVEEDEDIANWLVNDQGFENLRLDLQAQWQIVESESGYRFYPNKLEGEGFYLACFRAPGDGQASTLKPVKSKAEKFESVARDWLIPGEWAVQLWDENLVTYQRAFEGAVDHITKNLNVRQLGLTLGKMMKGRLVPNHALATSPILKPRESWELNREEAIRYLQRQEIGRTPNQKGWLQASYQGFGLGWVNSLGNRINNYYPKELRILKTTDDPAF